MLKNVTLSAEEEYIRKAREKTNREHTTLNATFRQWLKQYVSADFRLTDYDLLMKSFSYAKPDKSFSSRDEMNKRVWADRFTLGVIGAVAKSNDLSLATTNTKDFQRITDLELVELAGL